MAGLHPQSDNNYGNNTSTRNNKNLLFDFLFGVFTIFSIVPCLFFCHKLKKKYKGYIKDIKALKNTNTEKIKLLPRSPSTCSICIDQFKENEVIRIMPCNHQFHQKCVDPWILNYRKECPLCRQLIHEQLSP
jgi:hypothetical protein